MLDPDLEISQHRASSDVRQTEGVVDDELVGAHVAAQGLHAALEPTHPPSRPLWAVVVALLPEEHQHTHIWHMPSAMTWIPEPQFA
jgi:hypothetical protein